MRLCRSRWLRGQDRGDAPGFCGRCGMVGWHERRFEERPTAVHQQCLECGRDMWLPQSKLANNRRCSAGCNAAYRARVKVERRRRCSVCGETFTPRPGQLRIGQGKFCSLRCSAATHLTTPENLAKAAAGWRKLHAQGGITFHRGSENRAWMGGKAAYKDRRRLSGAAAAALRKYRKANPEKVREWAATRRSGKVERLPRGTIPAIGTAQKWRCAICHAGIRRSYEVDHIKPIAKGGKHEPRNLQLLCGPCNRRKSAKDPITHMRELGRLL